MEERRRGCSVTTEAPPPLLGLVAITVLPQSGCCATAKELEGMSCRRRALSPSRCVAAHHHRRILCHQFEGGYGFDSDDELQRLIKIEKVDAERAYLRNALVILEKLYTKRKYEFRGSCTNS